MFVVTSRLNGVRERERERAWGYTVTGCESSYKLCLSLVIFRAGFKASLGFGACSLGE